MKIFSRIRVAVAATVASTSSSSEAFTLKGAATLILRYNHKKRPIFIQNAKRKADGESTAAATLAPAVRTHQIRSLLDWAKITNIKISNDISLQTKSLESGFGWFRSTASPLKTESVLLSVPSDVAIYVESPGIGPDDSDAWTSILRSDASRKSLDVLPWYVQMSLYLYKLDSVSSTKARINLRPWLDSLPRTMSTPIHWSSDDRQELQYEFMLKNVQQQHQLWSSYYSMVKNLICTHLSWEQFLWGVEMARSRAFSGAYTGRAFNPFLYAFTLFLVSVYVGLNFGTLEQAANGSGFVLCAIVLQDFVIPKLLKKKRYVICPLIDMTNHQSSTAQVEVAFEYFSNVYSLFVNDAALTDRASAALPSTTITHYNNELFISYGPRSNDQLLQYFGFVESNNPHDVYILPPLRDWDIAGMEQAIGRPIAPGRLEKLDRAGLLGKSETKKNNNNDDDDDNSVVANRERSDGVVLNRVSGLDPAVLPALRVLVSTEAEWNNAGQAVGSFASANSGGVANEQAARAAARSVIETELKSKPTTLEEDRIALRRIETIAAESKSKSLDLNGSWMKLALQFRIEKKRLLIETIDKLMQDKYDAA